MSIQRCPCNFGPIEYAVCQLKNEVIYHLDNACQHPLAEMHFDAAIDNINQLRELIQNSAIDGEIEVDIVDSHILKLNR